MRNIKVRAWDKENKRWYDGCDGAIGWNGGKIFQNDGKLSFNAADGGKGLEFVEYTGLKDKNGREIYEGDILYFPQKTNNGVVMFGDGAYDSGIIAYRGFYVEESDGWTDSTGEWLYLEGIEVIGNIYENPELVKEVM